MTRRSVRQRRRRTTRGRPRDETAERTPSGRISRARRPREDPRAVALAARRRVLGLPDDLAGHEKASSLLGRLWLAGKITEALREAGERYLEIYMQAMRALTAPIGLAVSDSTGSPRHRVSEDYVEWATRAVARYEVLKAALEAEGAHHIVHAVVVADVPPPPANWPVLIRGLRVLETKLGIWACQ